MLNAGVAAPTATPSVERPQSTGALRAQSSSLIDDTAEVRRDPPTIIPTIFGDMAEQTPECYVCDTKKRKTAEELYQDGNKFKHRVRVNDKQIRCAYYCRACAFPPCHSCGAPLEDTLPIEGAQRKIRAGEPSYRVVYPTLRPSKDRADGQTEKQTDRQTDR